MNKEKPATRPAVKRRTEPFTKRISTRIWQETPSASNPYIAAESRCQGYDILELMQKRPYVDVLYLLFRGELPTPEEKQLLEALMVSCISPGPRHPATRAAMNAGVGKTDPSHILPIALSILGGNHLGATEVEAAMRWLRKHIKKDPLELASNKTLELTKTTEDTNKEPGDVHIAPGFGSRFGSIDIAPGEIASHLMALPGAGAAITWGNQFSSALQNQHMGWLMPGVVAATLCDLGFHPRMGPGLFQLMCAPGLLAHGVETASKPLTAMPFPDDADYFIEGQ